MPDIIDNIELDKTNDEFFLASELVKYGHPIIYLTGKAGTGKTTFLKYLKQNTDKKTIVLAFTGVAAINAGGQTIHSFFKVPFGPFVPNDKRLRTKPEEGDVDRSTVYNHFRYTEIRKRILAQLELLIIDEVSMVRCDLLDVIDKLLRVFRKREKEAFGGVQVVLIGDTFQLPPIDKEWHLLETFYESPFFFSSKVIKENKPIYIELKKVYRQKELEFIELLGRVRVNKTLKNDFKLLNSKYNPTFSPPENLEYITLATHNNKVASTNLTKLSNLPGEIKVFEADITGDFPDNIMPTDRLLQLKEGAQVMFIKNYSLQGIFNGKIARIESISDHGILVQYEENGSRMRRMIERETWHNIRYSWNNKGNTIENQVIGTFTQYPIKLAWAITVHKSQGLTFERVIVDLENAFASGQVYVALSRCTSLNGLILKTKIDDTSIHTDPQVIRFAKNETPNTLIINELNSGKADFHYRKLREDIKSLNFINAYSNFIKAIKLRNDIETDLFQRCFVVYGNKLGLFKGRYIDALLEITKKGTENEGLQEKIMFLEQEIKRQQTETIVKGKAVELLLSKNKTLENQTLKLEQEVKRQQTETLVKEKAVELLLSKNKALENETLRLKADAKKTVDQQREIIQTKQKAISRLEVRLKKNEQEIERLKNLKWHQKLFGQK